MVKRLFFSRALTVHGGQNHAGVVVGDDVCVAVLWLVYLHVGVLPGKLLARIDGLREQEGERERGGERGNGERGPMVHTERGREQRGTGG